MCLCGVQFIPGTGGGFDFSVSRDERIGVVSQSSLVAFQILCVLLEKPLCRGGGVSGTTMGNYTITLTGTSGSTTANGTVTLTVQ
jgi:hypothetical protein